MVKENVLKSPDVDAIFGLHISSVIDINTIGYKPGGIMAAAQAFEINVQGKQPTALALWLVWIRLVHR